MALNRLPLALVLFGLVACGSSTAPHQGGPPTGIQFIAGNHQTDTIETVFTQALDVRIASHAGQSSAGQVVQFIAVLDSLQTGYEAYVEPLTAPYPQEFVAETLDAHGQASVTIVLGTKAGPARVAVKVPVFGYTDTARFTVTPGGLAGLRTLPADTTAYSGGTFALRPSTVDRAGNPRTDAVQIAVASGPATISGTSVTTTGVGRITFITTSATMADTTHASSVPHGTLAASTGSGFATFNLDGSGYTAIQLNQQVGNIKAAPSGKSIVFDQSTGGCSATTGHLQTSNLSGVVSSVDQHAGGYDQYPSYSRDGNWIYYAANTGSSSILWRVHPDGTNDDSLASLNPAFDIFPSASPDGQQVAYTNLANGNGDLRILTLSSGAVTDLGLNAWSPEWAPVGTQIAYIVGFQCAGGIAIANADGSGAHGLTSSSYLSSFDWSPDGNWLVALNASTGHIDLINASTGAALPLGYTSGLSSPTWLP